MTTAIRQAEMNGQIDYTGQTGYFDPRDSDASVTIVGCGGIGSPLALALAKLGVPRMTLVDFDDIEARNLPHQLFPLSANGAQKVAALSAVCRTFGVPEVTEFYGRCTPQGLEHDSDEEDLVGPRVVRPSGIVVASLDSIDARKDLWASVKYNLNVPFFVDPRIAGEQIVIYALDPRKPDQIEAYERDALHDAKDSLPAPCTMRGVIDVGFGVAALTARAIRRHLAGLDVEPMLWARWSDMKVMAG